MCITICPGTSIAPLSASAHGSRDDSRVLGHRRFPLPALPARGAVSGMDAASIADITSLPVDKVKTVLRQHNMEKDQGGIERAINQFLEGTGPFKEAVQGSDWAESGKPRRGKKVRRAPDFSHRLPPAVRAPAISPA